MPKLLILLLNSRWLNKVDELGRWKMAKKKFPTRFCCCNKSIDSWSASGRWLFFARIGRDEAKALFDSHHNAPRSVLTSYVTLSFSYLSAAVVHGRVTILSSSSVKAATILLLLWAATSRSWILLQILGLLCSGSRLFYYWVIEEETLHDGWVWIPCFYLLDRCCWPRRPQLCISWDMLLLLLCLYLLSPRPLLCVSLKLLDCWCCCWLRCWFFHYTL